MKEEIRIRSRDGHGFDCYLVTPDDEPTAPAIVLASAIHGVDDDLRAIADELASHGFVTAAPDLFWRTVPGPLARDDTRSTLRGQPRLEKIRTGEQDLIDVLAMLRRRPSFNGRAAVMGFCYGGPYAIVGPRRLGYDAGIAFHGTQMIDFVDELDGLEKPVCVVWGDQDSAAPAPVPEAYRAAAARTEALEVHVLPGVQHGYMMRGATAFDPAAYEFSMKRALPILENLR